MFMLRALAAIAQLEAATVSHQGKLVGLHVASFTTDGEFITGINSTLLWSLCLCIKNNYFRNFFALFIVGLGYNGKDDIETLAKVADRNTLAMSIQTMHAAKRISELYAKSNQKCRKQ